MAENFRALCTSEKRFGFRNSTLHKIISKFMCEGGDFTNHNDTGGTSIYVRKFDDENVTLKHTGPDILSMANSSSNTKGSQFLTTSKTSWLDGKPVVFRKVIQGMNVIRKLEFYGHPSGRIFNKSVISDCGEL